MLFFFEIIMQRLAEEANRYYCQYLDMLSEGHTVLPEVSMQEMYMILSVILQMGYDQRDTLKGYWFTLEQILETF
jgi:hypothetical protein